MPVSWLLRTEHSLLAIGAVNAQLSPIYWQDMQSMIYPLWIDSKKRVNAKHKGDQLFLRLRLLATLGLTRFSFDSISLGTALSLLRALALLRFIPRAVDVNRHIGLRIPKMIFSPFQCLGGRHCGIARFVGKDIAFLNLFINA